MVSGYFTGLYLRRSQAACPYDTPRWRHTPHFPGLGNYHLASKRRGIDLASVLLPLHQQARHMRLAWRQRFGVRVDLGQHFAQRLERRGKWIALGLELAARIAE